MDNSASGNKLVRVGVAQPAGPDGPLASDTDLQRITATVAKNIARMCGLIGRAGAAGVDILCLPEDVCNLAQIAARGEDEACFRSAVQRSAVPSMESLRGSAKASGMYVVGAAFLPDGEAIHNTAFLIGPDGRTVGQYHKTHLPPSEDRFLTAGTAYPVFETPLGRVGMLICWDLMFPETTRLLALNGAQLVFCPTLGFDFGGEHMGEMRIRVRAFDNALHIATATLASPKGDGTGRSCIVGPQGEILADTGHRPDHIVWADLDPSQRSPDSAGSEPNTCADMWERWAQSRRPATYGGLA